MSSHTWRRATAAALTASALLGGVAAGVAVPLASADPADPSSEPSSEERRPVSPDQILMIISEEYQTGRGGGQVSKLIEQVMTLRMRGYRPSFSNTQALAAALEKRPNQGPLIEALGATLNYQRKQMAQAGTGAASTGGAPPVATPGYPGQPAWVPGNPMTRDDAIFPMPGR